MARSVMKHDFSRVPQADIQRSSFDRSHGVKTTLNAGFLVPVFVEEVLPGDTMNLHMTGFGRMATPIVPVMDNLFCDSFFFFVPNRLLWSNWQRFNGEQDDPGDSTDFLAPQVTTPGGGYSLGSLADYFGIPIGINNLPRVSAFWFRAYNLIWNQWFRDQNLQNSVAVNMGDGPDAATDYALLRRGKRHDYFTSALPWPQKGPGVQLPLGTSAPIQGIGLGAAGTYAVDPSVTAIRETTGDVGPFNMWANMSTQTAYLRSNRDVSAGPGGGYPLVYADLSQATAATINSLRQAFQVQRMYERDARGGTRYTEIIRSHFGVMSPDARLQRPEYIGGGSSMIHINPVTQNSATTDDSPQGNLAATGTMHLDNHGFKYSATEHGVIIGMISIRADLNYQQGLNRMWSRRTRFDFYWPALAHLGEQAILNQEIYATGTGTDDDVFGYQERFAEYRYKPSIVTGQFRSQAAGTLDIWHLAQNFSSLPLLNGTFIQENPPVSRIVAVTDQPQFLFDGYFRYHCARPMPMYSVPGMMDHF